MKSLQVIKADNLGIGNDLVYLHLGRAVLDQYGIEGDAALRRAIVRFATVRGTYLRNCHKALGMKINLKNHYYYNANPYHDTSVSEDIGHVTEQEDVRRVDFCPFADMMLKRGERYLIVTYCEEAHPPLWQSYAPTAIVNLGRTCGQEHSDHCEFDVFLRPGRMTAEQRKECFEEYDPDFKGDRRNEYKFMTDKQGAVFKATIMIQEFLSEFQEALGAEATNMVATALEACANDYYETLKQSAEENKLDFNTEFWKENCCFGESTQEDEYWEMFATQATRELADEHFYKIFNQLRPQ